MNPNASTFTPGGSYTVYDSNPYQEELDPQGYYEVSKFCEPNVQPESITALAFDPNEEALWSGSHGGRVVSYLSPIMQRYSCWKMSYDDVRQILPNEYGVCGMSGSHLRFTTRGGVVQLGWNAEQGADLQRMMFTNPRKTELLLGGQGENMYIFDLKRGRVQKEIPVSSGVTALTRSSRLLCVGHADGKVTMRDPRSYRIEHTFPAHTSGVADMDIRSDLLVTCGFGNRMGQVFVDPLVKVYDIRMNRVLIPLSFPAGPIFVRFHHKFSSSMVVVSQNNVFEMADVQSGVTGLQRTHLDTRGHAILAFDMSPSGETMVFGDMLGQIHHFADREQFKINNSARLSLEVVDPHPAPPAHRLNEMSSLATPSAFTFPYMLNATATLTNSGNFPGAKAKPSLLSDWPNDLMFPVSRPPEPIDPTLLKSMRQVDFVGIIPHMPGTKLRNQTKRLPPSKFEYHSLLLEAVKEADAAESFIPPSPDKPLTKSLRTRAPRNYRRIPIKASKLGFEDFDFKPFNKTGLSGIENILSNSYVNPILQMLYNIPQLRVAAQNHLCTADHCLMCELGFLFHMLDLSTGDSPCQTKNFLRTLREIPQALRLGLFEEDNPSAAIPKLIERFTVFLLQQLNKDSCHPPLISSTPGKPSKPLSTSESYIDKLFGSSVRITNHCQTCDQHTTIDNRALFHPLRIPLDNDDGESTTHSFAGLLKQALTNDEPTQSWCENCKTFQPSQHFKETTALPVVLCLQPTAIDPSLSFWANVTDNYNPQYSTDQLSQWLPFVVRIHRDTKASKWIVQEYTELTANVDQADVYELHAVVSSITDASAPKGHVVYQGRVEGSRLAQSDEGDGSNSPASWFLFNDFHVLPVSKYEVAHINSDWKIPSLLIYVRRDSLERVKVPDHVGPVTDEVMLLNSSKTTNAPKSFTPLAREDLPKPGDEVAVDTEFVKIRDEEIAERPGGVKLVVRPADFSLARVSVLSAKSDQGHCIIDDYIATKDSSIVDYLTQFSGIVKGDLDPTTSKHHVTSLKMAYLKLRWLVDRGCKFIGHGLAKDFRIMNLVVPKEQIIDTVELFYLDRQRKISLKFLASHLLGMDIQMETHDSIEDARTALLLYRKYQDLQHDGDFTEVLNEIYNVGRSQQWKLGGRDATSPISPPQDSTSSIPEFPTQ